MLAQSCPMLHTIDLTGCTRVTDIGIQAIALGCPLLKFISVRNASKLTGASLMALGAGCPLLEEFTCSKQAKFKNTDFDFLLSKCPRLRIVDCCMNTSQIRLLAKKCPNLQHISLDGDGRCAMIGGGCHRLEVVEIGCQTSDVGIEAIARGSPLLSDIRLCDCYRVTDKVISVLAQCCPMLHTIDLTGCTRVTDISLRAIALGCPLLKTMYLSGCSVSAEGMNALIRNCPQLIFLSMNNGIPIVNGGTKLTLEGDYSYVVTGIDYMRPHSRDDGHYEGYSDYFRQDDDYGGSAYY